MKLQNFSALGMTPQTRLSQGNEKNYPSPTGCPKSLYFVPPGCNNFKVSDTLHVHAGPDPEINENFAY